MTAPVLGLAQIGAVAGDVEANLARHLAVIAAAARAGVTLLVFPELSLTGYEPALAAKLAFTPDDARLTPLMAAAAEHRIGIVAGLPLVGGERPRVGALVVSADGEVSTYAKRHLHPGEETAFEPGEGDCLLALDGERIAIAICADTNAPEHAERCAALGATVYLAGVLITEGGYAADTAQLARTAARHDWLVGVANHNAPSGGMEAIGRSGFWHADGELVTADGADSLVIASRGDAGWQGRVEALCDSPHSPGPGVQATEPSPFSASLLRGNRIMPHLFTNRPRAARLKRSQTDLRKERWWEGVNALLYELGGVLFVIGSVLFFPSLEPWKDIGAWLFFVGSLVYLVVLAHDMIEVRAFWFQSHTSPSRLLEIVSLCAYTAGTLLFTVGSLFFLSWWHWIVAGAWCFVVGSLFFVFGAGLNVLMIIRASSLITLQLMNLTAVMFVTGSVLFLVASVPYLWSLEEVSNRAQVLGFLAWQFLIGSALFLIGGLFNHQRARLVIHHRIGATLDDEAADERLLAFIRGEISEEHYRFSAPASRIERSQAACVL
ncbi:YrhK family protein [Salinicola aestuarinus]|uniref:YrhK family protein n=1 Tax=Salinicola aestuarinus TaxID=1949082 RepID=UPI001CB6BA05|nr:YrhK family protein [Salinicola aestuarinus]